MGGLSRRASVVASTAKPRITVEGANWAWKSSYIKEEQLAQQKLKGELQLEALSKSGIDAIGVGPADMLLGLDWFEQRKGSYPFVATNLRCAGSSGSMGNQQ